MTSAPSDLITVQGYAHEKTGQPFDSLGIIHSTPQGGGYHEGEDLLIAAGRAPGPQYPDSDYSYRDAPDRDLLPNGRLAGGNLASAFDFGGGFSRFLEFNAWMLGRLQANDPRVKDIREMIYTPDGHVVRRFDRTGKQPNSGDSSHLSHTHFSFFRDSSGRRSQDDNFLGLLRKFFGEGSPMADTDIPETFRTARNGDKWGYDIVTGAQPAHFLGSDSVDHTTPNVLHNKLDAILANTTADLAEDRAATAALQAMATLVQSGGGNLDIAPVLAAVQAARDAVLAEVAGFQDRQRQAADAAAQALRT